MRWLVLSCFAFTACATPATQRPHSTTAVKHLPSCHEDAKWTEPAPPLRIYANTWFVGTCGISSILITSPQGHVLIDGGVQEAAPLVEANIRALGFRLTDIHYILNSHEHYDHAGAIAQLQRDSGAVALAREPAARAFERGRGDRSDPQFLNIQSFAPIANVHRIADGAKLALGPIRLVAHATPGHTPGSTSWTWDSCEGQQCVHIVYADSLTAISDDVYKYTGESQHSGVAQAFKQSVATVAALPCDILLTPHPDASAMWSRLGPEATLPLIDTRACQRYAANASKNLDARFARERTP